MQDDEPVRIDTRLSGQLRRYHTWPINRDQSVAEHCWQILRIYYASADRIDPHMIYHITFHDIGEQSVGDPPYPVKSNNPELKEKLDSLEQQSYYKQLGFWDSFQQIMLTDEDKKFFKQIELVEMAEFGMGEVLLGNSNGFIIADRCLKAVYAQIPRPRLAGYIKKRLGIFFLQFQFKLTNELGPWWNIEKWEEIRVGK